MDLILSSDADPGCFFPDPGSGSESYIFSFRIPDPDPNNFHPGSYTKRGIKNTFFMHT
jgi:hypothetical protein